MPKRKKKTRGYELWAERNPEKASLARSAGGRNAATRHAYSSDEARLAAHKSWKVRRMKLKLTEDL